MKKLWYYLLGWRKGLPKENGTYLFQFPNKEQRIDFYVRGSKDFFISHATHYKKIKGP